MAKRAVYFKNDGTAFEISAQGAVTLDDSVEFFCMGHDATGSECGCHMHLKPRTLKAGGVSWHFCGKHIPKCNEASFTKEINRTRKVLTKLGFEKLLDRSESEPAKGGKTTDGGDIKPKKSPTPKEEEDISVDIKERESAPTTAKDIYTLIVNSLPDEVIDGIEVRSLRCDEWALSRGLCKRIEGVKLVVCERCLVPENIERKDNEIVLRICGTEDELSRYIILSIEKEFVCKKVWNVLRCDKTKKSETKDKFVVLGKFEAIDQSFSRCNIFNSKMIQKL